MVTDKPPDIAANLAAVKARMVEAARGAGRAPEDVTLVAVAKAHAAPAARAALAAGHRVFGENRMQEAAAKWPELREEFAAARLHLIGPLQRNKARRAVALFDVIETIDREALAAAVARAMDAAGRRPECFVQVNTGDEAQKAGARPAQVDALIRACCDDYGLPISGLMCIPPVDEEPALHFALLGEIARRNGLARLSMGMTADFDVAIRFGATHVRVGSAVFGPRSLSESPS